MFVLFFGLVSFSFGLIPPGFLNPLASFCRVKNFAISTKNRRHTNADMKKDGTWEGLQNVAREVRLRPNWPISGAFVIKLC